MNGKQDYILDHMGDSVTWDMVDDEYNGKSFAEVLTDLNDMFPHDDNDELAQAIVDELS